MPTFSHYDLTLLNPSFDSPLVDVLTELEHLRRLQLQGTTPPSIFYQLKAIFHILESLGSARIEGNHTTLADYIESKLDGTTENPADPLREMGNIEDAMRYVEETIHSGIAFSDHLVRELHTLTVQQLSREGDRTPGAYRQTTVRIAQAQHLPPEPILVSTYMQELVNFINADDPPKYDLIKIALAHHRFAWIHPFSNGNGRVVRLLTYALLIKYGFNVTTGGRLLNPTAVFCNDRNLYYTKLSRADTGQPQELETWCIYVLEGMLNELKKVDQLTKFDYLKEKILAPAIRYAHQKNLVNEIEMRILLTSINKKNGIIKSSDLTTAMPKMTTGQRSYQIKKLVETNMLVPIEEGARQYTIGFSHSYLIRGIILALYEQGFIPETLNHRN